MKTVLQFGSKVR